MSHFIDITGQKFGMLTVIERAGTTKNQNTAWLCRCDCGKEVIANGSTLRRGDKKSCGCRGRYKITYVGYCEYCGEAVDKIGRRFCSPRCAGKANHGVERVEVDVSFPWKSAGQGLWLCRYRKNIRCKDRNCAKCGWNPEVAVARTKAIMEKRKVEVLLEDIPRQTCTGRTGCRV